MSDIYDETILAAQEERKIQFFNKVFPYVLSITILIAASISFYYWRVASIEQHKESIGDLFSEVVLTKLNNDIDVKMESLQRIIKNADNRQVELAKVQLALLKFQNHQQDEAMIDLEAIASDNSNLPVTQNFAKILWVNYKIDADKITMEERSKISGYLKSFTSDKPFYGSGMILKSLFYAKYDEKEKAKQTASHILKDPNINSTIKEQARMHLVLLQQNTTQ